MSTNYKHPRRLKTFAVVAFCTAHAAVAGALELRFDDEPSVTRNGNGHTIARYDKIADQNGEAIDLVARIEMRSPNRAASQFDTEDDGLAFRLSDAKSGETHVATVRYAFFRHGTNTPVEIDDVVLGISGFASRSDQSCSLFTSDAVAFTLEQSSNLIAHESESGLSITGVQMHDPAAPRSANLVQLDFGSCDSFEISYGCDFHTSKPATFIHHGASKNSPFRARRSAPVAGGQDPSRLYFTYEFENDASVPIVVSLSDILPVGVEWDPSYEPVVQGDLAPAVVFGDENRSANVTGLDLPPGSSKLTIGTVPVEVGTRVANNPIIKFRDGTSVEAENGHAEITVQEQSLTPNRDVIDRFAESRVPEFAVIATGALFKITAPGSAIIGDAASTKGVHQAFNSGAITGQYHVHPPAVGSTGNVDTKPGKGGKPLAPVYHNLESLKSEALEISAMASKLTPTQEFGNIKKTTTIKATSPDGVNVIQIAELSLTGHSDLVLSGSDDDYFILNIETRCKFTGRSGLMLTGGIEPGNVIINLGPRVSELKMSGDTRLSGAVLAVNENQRVKLGKGASIAGSVAAFNFDLSGGSRVNHVQFD